MFSFTAIVTDIFERTRVHANYTGEWDYEKQTVSQDYESQRKGVSLSRYLEEKKKKKRDYGKIYKCEWQ